MSLEEISTKSTHLTQLPHRSLVNIKGKDGANLLQGLVTSDVTELGQRSSQYALLLNAQVWAIMVPCLSILDTFGQIESVQIRGMASLLVVELVHKLLKGGFMPFV